MSVDRLACGNCQAPLSAVAPANEVLSAPSSVCRRVCKAADFFQYAVHGTVAEGALRRRALHLSEQVVGSSGAAVWFLPPNAPTHRCLLSTTATLLQRRSRPLKCRRPSCWSP